MNRRSFTFGAAGLAALAPRVARAAAPDAIRVAALPTDGSLEYTYGTAEGIPKQFDLAPELANMTNGGAMMASLIGGSLDLVHVNVISMLQSREKNIPITMIAPGALYTTAQPQEVLMVPNGSAVRTARDLEGKTVGVDGLRNLTQLAVISWMAANGADSKTVKYAELPFSQMPAALAANRLDAAIIVEPYATMARKDARVLAKAYDAIAPQFLVSSWVATQAWTAAHPDVARRFAASCYKTAAWANKNRKATGDLLMQAAHLDAAIIAAMPRATFAEKFDPALLRPVIDGAVKYGMLSNAIAVDEILAPEVHR